MFSLVAPVAVKPTARKKRAKMDMSTVRTTKEIWTWETIGRWKKNGNRTLSSQGQSSNFKALLVCSTVALNPHPIMVEKRMTPMKHMTAAINEAKGILYRDILGIERERYLLRHPPWVLLSGTFVP